MRLLVTPCLAIPKSAIRIAKFFALCSLLLATNFSAHAQQNAKIFRIGFLFIPTASVQAARLEALRQRLRELGYVEGKNILLDYRYADGQAERLPELAAELVRLKVDVIVTTGLATSAAQQASTTIPIVFTGAGDPVGTGLVTSLARPGSNITGLSLMLRDLDGKRLELLKESFPKFTRVAYLWISVATTSQRLTEIQAAANALGIKLQSLEVRGPEEIDDALARAKRNGTQGLITGDHPLINVRRRQVVDFAANNRLPAIYPDGAFVEAGGLMSYAPNQLEMYRRAAEFVDKILKGAKPADIPVEQPKNFYFIVNLKTAKQIGLAIPPNVLVRADKVIQ